jgi:hypothetical protein
MRKPINTGMSGGSNQYRPFLTTGSSVRTCPASTGDSPCQGWPAADMRGRGLQGFSDLGPANRGKIGEKLERNNGKIGGRTSNRRCLSQLRTPRTFQAQEARHAQPRGPDPLPHPERPRRGLVSGRELSRVGDVRRSRAASGSISPYNA